MTNTPAERSTEPPVESGIAPAYSSADYASTEGSGSAVPTVGYSSFQPDDSTGDAESSTTDVAKGEAAAVKDTAVEAGQNVAETAKGEAANVAEETKVQAKGLLDSVSSQVQEQAGTQQRRLADTVQGLAGELGSMASGSQESGALTDLARQGADKGQEIAGWLQDKEPRDVLEQVKSFARRRPVRFLVLCGAAGVAAGRLTRGAIGANTSLDTPGASRGDRHDGSDRGDDTLVGGRELSAGSVVPLMDEPALGEHATSSGQPAGGYATQGYVAEEYPSQTPAMGTAGTGGYAAGSVGGVPTTGRIPRRGRVGDE